jgi:hypothetical protein
VLFEEAGFDVAVYDPYYADIPELLDRQYDFITASEVVEHLREPSTEWAGLWSCLKAGGILGIMTKLVIDADAFSRWHYKNDPTHICFYSVATFEWLAGYLRAELRFPFTDVVLLIKNKRS